MGEKLDQHVDQNRMKEVRKEERQFRALNGLFYILSQGGEVVTKKTLREGVEELPLVLIKIMEKIIESIYQGRNYSWLEFLGAVNSSKVVVNREALLTVTEKWLSRSTIQKEQL